MNDLSKIRVLMNAFKANNLEAEIDLAGENLVVTMDEKSPRLVFHYDNGVLAGYGVEAHDA